MRVLCVEDEAPLREDMAEYLRMHSYEVDEAECGEDALERLTHNQYDLVLCDIKMPRMDGFDVLRKIRGQDHLTSMPFIFLSALNERDDRMRAHYWGCDGFLTKPIDFSVLDVTLKSHIDRQRARDFAHTMAHDSLRNHMMAAIDVGLSGPMTEAARIVYHLRETLPVLTPCALDAHLESLQQHVTIHSLNFHSLYAAMHLQINGTDGLNKSMRIEDIFAEAVNECRYLYPDSRVRFTAKDPALMHYLFGDVPLIRKAIAGLLSVVPKAYEENDLLGYDVVDHTSILTVSDHPIVLVDSGEFVTVSENTDFTLIGDITRERLIPLMYALQVAQAHDGRLEIKISEPDLFAVRITLPNSTAAAWLHRAKI